MSAELLRARELLAGGVYTCAACKDKTVYTSTERGVAPLVKWTDAGIDLHGYSVADKIVGKAAAMLYVLLGVKEVYAPVMSEDAVYTLARYGILSCCDMTTKEIINREGTGICPMEKLAKDIVAPADFFIAALQRVM